MVNTVLGMVRTSTNDDDALEAECATQRRKASEAGLVLDRIVAFTKTAPAATELAKFLASKQPVTVVVTSRDRITRNPAELPALFKAGVDLIILDELA